MVLESTGLAQVENLVASSSTEDNALQTSAGEPGAVEFVIVPITSEAIIITVSEVSARSQCRQNLLLALSLPLASWLPPLRTLHAPS